MPRELVWLAPYTIQVVDCFNVGPPPANRGVPTGTVAVKSGRATVCTVGLAAFYALRRPGLVRRLRLAGDRVHRREGSHQGLAPAVGVED